jgi:VIT1/CCC1 family predicted Fe2+/Mn2+ transporter
MMMADCDHPLDALAHAERVRDRAVPGSPSRAAAGAFLSFSAGALVPAAPLLALPASYAMTTTLGVSAIALVALGMRLALFAGASPVHAGVRMLALGGGAASVSYAVGRLLGVAL